MIDIQVNDKDYEEFEKYLNENLSVPRLRNFFKNDGEYEHFMCRNIYKIYINNKKSDARAGRNFSLISGIGKVALSIPSIAVICAKIGKAYGQGGGSFIPGVKEVFKLVKGLSWVQICVVIGVICVVIEQVPSFIDACKKIVAAFKNEEYVDPETAVVVPLSGGALVRDANSNKYEDNEVDVQELVAENDKKNSFNYKNMGGSAKLFR